MQTRQGVRGGHPQPAGRGLRSRAAVRARPHLPVRAGLPVSQRLRPRSVHPGLRAGRACPEGAFCADLSLGAEGRTMPDSWRGRHCLRRCNDDSDCAAGQSCRALPAAGTPERWERACFYRFPGELGAACRGRQRAIRRRTSACRGLCADLGALGVCSFDCTSRPCPTGTTCAAFHDGRKLCLPPCSSPDSCRSDPLLACAPAGRPGPLGWDAAGRGAGPGHALRPQALRFGRPLRARRASAWGPRAPATARGGPAPRRDSSRARAQRGNPAIATTVS